MSNIIDPEYYNTQRDKLNISEYGRNVQEMVIHIKSIEDRTKRNLLAAGVVNVMANLNPSIREMENYKQKLWDHLFAIADFDLDVDSPYPIPERQVMFSKPNTIPYQSNMIRFRFYGRNVQNMILAAAEMEEGETRTAFINLIASFMRNSCKSWNNEDLSESAISEHMRMLSGGKLNLSSDEITILFHTKDFPRYNNSNSGGGHQRNNRGANKGRNNSNFRNNRNNRNNRNSRGK